MKIIIKESYELMCKAAAVDVIETMQLYSNPLLCPASGDTTLGFYKAITKIYAQENLDFSSWLYVGLDEWNGLNETDEGSCKKALCDQLFIPLGTPDDNICFFDGRAAYPENECTRAELFIKQQGQIDVAVLGLGMNGHIGMNEPGTPATSRSHVSLLAPQTQEVSKKYFKDNRTVTTGITLGLATLLEAKHIFLLVNGSHKAAITKKMIEESISESVPGSLFKTHPDFRIYLDAGAASLLA